ncbi:MAG: response regulator [bacterium]|nr:response regulator [bacterium]
MTDPTDTTVLIVEDEDDFREMLMFEFSAKGYRVLTAADGQDGAELSARHPVSAVVTDVRMPRLDGFALLDRIKSRDVDRPAVILISAYTETAPEEAHHSGAEALFFKPFHLRDLEKTVSRLITPTAQRWSKASPEPPVGSIELCIGGIDDGAQRGMFALGRGGVFLRAPSPPPGVGKRVAFRVEVESGPLREVSGSGVVKWSRSADGNGGQSWCGVEFEHLHEASFEAVSAWLRQQRIVPFIPRAPQS